MTTLSQVFQEEHRKQVVCIEHVQTIADSIGSASVGTLREEIGHVYFFLTQQLLPYAQAEEQVLYPAIGKLLGALEATATMSRDHLEVLQLTEELETQWLHLFYASLSTSNEQALRRVLYGLYAIIKLHLAKEEELYLPLLETRLSALEGTRLVEAMERTAAEAKIHLQKKKLYEEAKSVPASARCYASTS